MKKLMSIIVSILFALSVSGLAFAQATPATPTPEAVKAEKKADAKQTAAEKKAAAKKAAAEKKAAAKKAAAEKTAADKKAAAGKKAAEKK